jgi:hypothetical protein
MDNNCVQPDHDIGVKLERFYMVFSVAKLKQLSTRVEFLSYGELMAVFHVLEGHQANAKHGETAEIIEVHYFIIHILEYLFYLFIVLVKFVKRR